ncbi:MAG: NUDIX domain-containing protein [Chloroflexi bacterium]|nr:NUDIX domain-containing protein [Chloroflexota bacterium]MCL5273146.1 NUDIX domain-containing protein [Chloroflexota bacterium]
MKPYPTLLYTLSRLRWRITRPVTLGIRLLLVKDQNVLLVRHTYQPYWFLVGGGVKRHETLQEAARREAAEEVGAQLGALRLHGVFTNFFDYKSDHVVVLVCADFTLTDRQDYEIERRAFFPFDHLPDDIAAGHKRRIREYAGGQTGAIVEMW